jgi:hypothetical protein
MAARKRSGTLPLPPVSRRKREAASEAQYPRPAWMSDRSLLPKKPPGRS